MHDNDEELARNGLLCVICNLCPSLEEVKDRIHPYYIGPVADRWPVFVNVAGHANVVTDDMFISSMNRKIQQGKDILVLYNPSEPILDGHFEKIHRCLPKINTDARNIILLTGSLDGQKTYENFCR